MNPNGCPTKYREIYNEQAYKLCLLGATDKELADFFEVEEKTINNWKIDFPEFLQSLKKGKEMADAEVADKLYKRATGYNCKATKFATFEGQITDTMDYVEHHPPDTTAAIFWLKNRQRGKWRDKQEIESNNTNNNINANVDIQSDEDFIAELKRKYNQT